jgi:hypothetical protein
MERITLAALRPEIDPSNNKYYNSWHGFVNEMMTDAADTTDSYKKSLHNKFGASLNQRRDIATEIIRVVLRTYLVDNAFYCVTTWEILHVVCLVLLQPIR